jgi:enoyl-CoA hydratase/carnithine racemase
MEQIVIEHHDAVAVLRLNRPPANAIDLDFAGALEAAFARLVDAGEARAVVFTGTGECFSAGLDLKLVPRYSRDEQRTMLTTINRMLAKLYGCPLPVVGAINGHAVAAGLILALACDYRVATNTAAKLGLTEVRAGIPFPAAAMAVLQTEVAPSVARALTLRGNNVDASTALADGLVDELQPPKRVLSTAIDVARDLASMPRDAYARIKCQLRARTIATIDEIVARGSDPMLDAWLSGDASAASAGLLRRSGPVS